MKEKNSFIKYNGNLPSYIVNLEDGDYICKIETYQQAMTRFGNKLIIKICTIEESVPNMVFKVYYDLEGDSIRITSPLGCLLKDLNLIKDNQIQWSDLKGKYVIAEVLASDRANMYVKKLRKLPDDIVIEDDEKIEYSEEKLEFD